MALTCTSAFYITRPIEAILPLRKYVAQEISCINQANTCLFLLKYNSRVHTFFSRTHLMHSIHHCKPLHLPGGCQTVSTATLKNCCRIHFQFFCKFFSLRKNSPPDLRLESFFISTSERGNGQDLHAYSYKICKPNSKDSLKQRNRAVEYCTSPYVHRKLIIPKTPIYWGNIEYIYITALQQELASPRRYSAFAAAAAACTACSNVMETKGAASTSAKRDSSPSICWQQLRGSANGLPLSKGINGVLRLRFRNSDSEHEESGRIAGRCIGQTAALRFDNSSRTPESTLDCEQCTSDGILVSGRHSFSSTLSSDVNGGKSSSSAERVFTRRRDTVGTREHSCAEGMYMSMMPEQNGEFSLQRDVVDRNESAYSKLDHVRGVQLALHAALTRSETPEEVLAVAWKYLAAIRNYSQEDYGVTVENTSHKNSGISFHMQHVTAQEAADFGLVNTAHALQQLVRVAVRANRLSGSTENETRINDISSLSSNRFPVFCRSNIYKRSVQYDSHRKQQPFIKRQGFFMDRTSKKESQESEKHSQLNVGEDLRFAALLQCAQHHLLKLYETSLKCKAFADVKPAQLRFLASLCWVYGKLKLHELWREEKGRGKVEETHSKKIPVEESSLFVHSCFHVAESSTSAGHFSGIDSTSRTAGQFSGCVGNEANMNRVCSRSCVADACETLLFLLGKCVTACLPLFSTYALPVALWGLAQAQYGRPRKEHEHKYEMKKNSTSSPTNTSVCERVSIFKRHGAEEDSSFLQCSVAAAVCNRDASSTAARASNSPSMLIEDSLSSIHTEGAIDEETSFWKEAAKSLKIRVRKMPLRLLATAAHACAAVEFRDEELLHAFATRAIELLERSRQEALSPSFQLCGVQSDGEHSTEQTNKHSTFQQQFEISTSCASTTRTGPVLVSDASTRPVHAGNLRGESGEDSSHKVACFQEQYSLTACKASSLAVEAGFEKQADSVSIGGSLSILLSSFVKLGVSSPSLFSMTASFIVTDCFRKHCICSAGISWNSFSSSTVTSPSNLSAFEKRPYYKNKHYLESCNICSKKENVKQEAMSERNSSPDIGGTARTAVEVISAQCCNSFLFRLKPLEVTAFAWAFAHSCVNAAKSTKLKSRSYRAPQRDCFSRETTLPTKKNDIEAIGRVCSQGSTSVEGSVCNAPAHICADLPLVQKRQICPECPDIENIDCTLILPYTLWTVFTVLKFLAFHALQRHYQYTLADKVRFCWALAVYDLFVPMLFQSVISILERWQQAEQLHSCRDVPFIANCKKTSNFSKAKTFNNSTRRVNPGHGEIQYSQETPSQDSSLADSSARARRHLKVQHFVEVWNRTDSTREGNVRGVDSKVYAKTLQCSNDALYKHCRESEERKSDPFSESYRPFENHLLSFQLQTQFYFALLCLITRNNDEGVLLHPEQQPQVRTSAYGAVDRSRLPKCSAIIPQQPLRSSEHSNTQSNKWAATPLKKKCASPQIINADDFLCELEKGRNNAHLMPTTFFRCRASLNTHPDRSENCRTSRQHVQVLSVLRRVMQGETHKSNFRMDFEPSSNVAAAPSSSENEFYNNSNAGRYISQMGTKNNRFTSTSRRVVCKSVLCTKIDQLEVRKDSRWRGWQATAEYRDVSGFWLDAVLMPPKVLMES